MDIADYKYRATFKSLAKVIAPSEEDRFVAKASLQPLKHLLPADLDPESDPDLLYISCNGAVAGLVNRNGDAVSCETALKINASARNKYISTDHDRDKVVGVILYPGLSTFGSNEPLTEEQAGKLGAPFNMAFAGVLWKVISPMLSKYLIKVGDATDADALSMSWEIAFNSFDIGIGSRNLFDAQIVKADDAKFTDYLKLLRAEGGNGKDPSGNDVFRIINGDPVILGYSIVPNPAALVKGILPIAERADEVTPDAKATTAVSVTVNAVQDIGSASRAASDPLVAAIKKAVISAIVSEAHSQKSEEKNITSSDTRVTPRTDITMKIDTVSQIESQWADLRKMESAASIVDFVRKMEEQSKLYLADKEAKDKIVQSTQAAKAETDEKVQTLEKSIAQLQKELNEVRSAASAAEQHQKFQERMAQFDGAFDLDDADRKIIAKTVKTVDDTAFATYFEECQVLLAAKKKKAAPFGKDDKKQKDDDDKEDKKDGGKDEDDESDASAKEALASVKEDANQTKPVNGQVDVNVTLAQEMAEAFGASFKINGKAVGAKKDEKKQ